MPKCDISIKLLCNFIEITLRHWCSPVNFLHIFSTTFNKNTFRGLLVIRITTFNENLGNILKLKNILGENIPSILRQLFKKKVLEVAVF